MKTECKETALLDRREGSLPESVELPVKSMPLIACGPEKGNTVCVTDGGQAYVSWDIGDLTDAGVLRFYEDSVGRMIELLGVKPQIAVCDLHPDYVSTRFAGSLKIDKIESVQHHHAHAAACMLENGLEKKVIAVTFDGMGLGDDGSIWGGEFLVCDYDGYRRVSHLKPYPLPGGDQATLHPERMAFSCLAAEYGADSPEIAFVLPDLQETHRDVLARMMDRGLNSPITTSAGRLFDAVAAMLGFTGRISFPAEAAVWLQKQAALDAETPYSFSCYDGVLDLAPALHEIVGDLHDGEDTAVIAGRFHATLAAGTVETCVGIADKEKTEDVVLSGGVFCNDLLAGRILAGLRKRGLSAYTHRFLPPGDCSISLGQAVVAAVRNGK